eukprot:2286408-Pyramimonas_sp.AAC.2
MTFVGALCCTPYTSQAPKLELKRGYDTVARVRLLPPRSNKGWTRTFDVREELTGELNPHESDRTA